jgi:hypothetical protein
VVQTDQGRDNGAPAACPSTEDLLNRVTRELNKFEAKSLPQLKAELEAFVKKKENLVSDYTQKYPGLREKWCTQHQQVEKLHAALKCAFPDWKKIVSECVCKPRHEIYCFEQQIQKRKRCCQGKRERARDQAKDGFDWAKARLDALSANAQKIADDLTTNDKLIRDVQTLLPGPDQEIVLYIFWFDLLPRHKRLTPEDVSEECKKFANEESPEKICEAMWDEKCPEEEGACIPPDYEQPATPGHHRRTAPWLLLPADYPGELDCAWDDYHEAKDDFAVKDAEYKADPDDLTALGKKLDDQKKGLDDQIKICLKKSRAEDECCKKPPGNGAAPSDPKAPSNYATPPGAAAPPSQTTGQAQTPPVPPAAH